MFDLELRPVASRALEPLAAPLTGVRPEAITVLGGIVGVVAALAAALSLWPVAVLAWLFNRLLDGLDGAVARAGGGGTDAGGYLDITVDSAVHAVLTLGVAVGLGSTAAWVATAMLVASFYFNTVTWAYLSALAEKRRSVNSSSQADVNFTTSVVMPRGLIEGAETAAFFTVLLLVPMVDRHWPVAVMWAMAGLVTLGAVVRFANGHRSLR